MNDFDGFDASGLRRLDRPHGPRESADQKIRQGMLRAFDDETKNTESSEAETADSDVVILDVEFDGDEADQPAIADSPKRLYRVAVAAAVAMLLGIGVVLSFDDPADVNPAQQNETAVTEFCTSTFEDLIDVFVEFERSPNGEFRARALRNLELLSQGYADLADELAEPLSAEVQAMGADFLARAAEVRVDMTVTAPTVAKPESMASLISDLGAAIEQLPGSSSCRTSDLQGG